MQKNKKTWNNEGVMFSDSDPRSCSENACVTKVYTNPSRVQKSKTAVKQIEDDLNKANDLIKYHKSREKQAIQEAEEARMSLEIVNAKLEESQRQVMEVSDIGNARVQELRKVYQKRDQAWEAEVEALKKLNDFDASVKNVVGDGTDELQYMEMLQATNIKLEADNKELESEVRKLKLQAEQWKKALEKMASFTFQGMEEEAGKKRRVKFLKKIGYLWNTGPK